MNQFETMMQRLRSGVRNEEIERSSDRTGVITPASLLHFSATPDNLFCQVLIESVGQVMAGLDGYVEELMAKDPALRAEAEKVLGTPLPPAAGIKAFEPRDLIKVRVGWRMEVLGTRMSVTAWHFVRSAVEPNGQGGHCIFWPEKTDVATQYWPPRMLTEALACASFSMALHAAKVSPEAHLLKH